MILRFKPSVPIGEERETKLVSEAQRGSREAFDALVRTHERLLRGFLMRRVGANAVDDVLQETWFAGWTALPRYNRRSRFKAWIFAIAYHKCADHQRSRARGVMEAPLEEADRLGVVQRDAYADADLRETVRALLAQLPAEQREVMEVYYFAGLTLAEVAQVLDRNINTVKTQFYRAHTLAAQSLDPACLSSLEPGTALKGKG